MIANLKFLLLAAALAGSLPAAAAPEPAADDFYAQTLFSAARLQQWYNRQGLWDSTGWWNAANCLDAIESVIVADNGEQYTDVIRTTFDRNARGKFLNQYYDDEGWWALAWIRAFDLTGNRRYLAAAKTIFSDMSGGWDDHCGGGIWWTKERTYKNAIANELFLLVAVRLSERTAQPGGNAKYLAWARREWTWFRQSGMINPQHLVNDGLTAACENNHRTTWTYNQGVLIGGLTELYETTGDSQYLTEANALAHASLAALTDPAGVLAEPREEHGLHGGDVPQFKGIFIRYLAGLYEVTDELALREFLVRNARSVWRNDRDAEGNFGGHWRGPVDAIDAARQSSALSVFAALAGTVTANCPAGNGALDLTAALAHEIGRRDTQGNWSANRLQDSSAGCLASGPGIQNLAAGACEVHFELKVDNFCRDSAPVATLSVADRQDQKILALRTLKRTDFATVLFQTFTLRFHARPGHRYDCRVFWHPSPAAPRLTLRCVAIKPAKPQRY